MVVNIHQRSINAPLTEVHALIASLASRDDRLWPHEAWPRMRLDRGLQAGSAGGHGPVRYHVEEAEPGRVVFRFTGPRGFDGGHAFSTTEDSDRVVLRHELRMRARGWARLSWPLFFRPLHDALIEEALDKAQRSLGASPARPHRRSTWVRALRALARPRSRSVT